MAKGLKKSVSRGCLTGEGASVKEAKADLNGKIDAALENSYTPVVLSYHGRGAVIYRCPVGWSYDLFDLSEDGKSVDRCSHFVGAREDAVNSAAYHIIQNACDVQAIRSDADLPAWFTDRSKRDDLVSWCRWQRAAAYAKKTGVGEQLIHGWACEHERDERFA